MLQLTRRGTVWTEAECAVPRMIQEFARQHCVRLPQLLEPYILDRIQSRIEAAEFDERTYDAVGSELRMRDDACSGTLGFLVNDPGLYRAVEVIARCGPIGRFVGRVYRKLPGQHDDHEWHSDVAGDRLVGMSVNLSTQVYEGGVFELREAATSNVLASIRNIGAGDAILFRISPDLEHRVTAVSGANAKTAFAGWFCAERDYIASLREKSALSRQP